MKSALRPLLTLLAVAPVALAACSASTGDEMSEVDEQALRQGVATRPRVTVTCEAQVVPECGQHGLWGDSCGEGHDETYTAYEIDAPGAEATSWRPLIHHDCVKGWPCSREPIPTTLTRAVVLDPVCPGERVTAAARFTIADDDGCSIACAGGDMLCCAGLRTRVAPAFKWTEVSTVTARVACTSTGCTVDASGTNQGTGPNQLAGVQCRVNVTREPVPAQRCGGGGGGGDNGPRVVATAESPHEPRFAVAACAVLSTGIPGGRAHLASDQPALRQHRS